MPYQRINPPQHETRREAAAEQGTSFTPRKRAKDAHPESTDQINFTDPESRIMVCIGTFAQAFNAQIAVDAESQIVLAAQVGNDAAAVTYLPSVLEEATANTGESPTVVTADAGYYSKKNVEHVRSLGVEALIPPVKMPRRAWRAQQALRGRIPKNHSAWIGCVGDSLCGKRSACTCNAKRGSNPCSET